MLMGALLIHLTGGRIETHFHVFGSLAFLAFYRDPWVLLNSTLVVSVDHLIWGFLLPQSVYGVLGASSWRFVEHAFWVLFEDIFLVLSCVDGWRQLHETSSQQAELEAVNATVESAVRIRTRELEESRESLRASEEQFRNLFENSPAGIYRTTPDGTILLANPDSGENARFRLF